MGKSTKSTTKRPWASNNSKKTKDYDVDMALLKTATSLADKVLQPEPPTKSRIEEEEDEDEDALYCRSLATRLRNLPVHVKGYVRLQIEQLMYKAQFPDHPVAQAMSGMSSGTLPSISTSMSYQRPEYTHFQTL